MANNVVTMCQILSFVFVCIVKLHILVCCFLYMKIFQTVHQ
jgi:hypothetical protein